MREPGVWSSFSRTLFKGSFWGIWGKLDAPMSFFLFFSFFLNYMFKGRIETNENRRKAGGFVTLLDEPYLAFMFDYLPSPPSSQAVGAMSVVVTVAYIAAVVELSLACLCSIFFLERPSNR
jgi:hypothetical protein